MLYLRSANAEHQSTSGLLNMSQCVKLSETSLKLGDDEATKFLLSFYTGLRELSIFKNSVSFIKLCLFSMYPNIQAQNKNNLVGVDIFVVIYAGKWLLRNPKVPSLRIRPMGI